MTAGDIRPGARGGRAARRANQHELEADRLKSLGALSNEQMKHEQAWAEKLNCPICRQAVHPTNWSAHMSLKHADKNIPLHEADPGRLPLTAIRIDGGTQPRAQMNQEMIDSYAEDMLNGDKFKAIDVYFDGKDYWLADGFHRVQAAQKAGLTDIRAVVYQGTQRDAILHSVGVNRDHGLRRTNEDKRRGVERLLRDEEWGKWSDREIARKCAVHHDMVGKVRKELSGGNRQITEERTVQRGDSTYTQNTSKISQSNSLRYGQNEDDYQPDVPEVQVDETPPNPADHFDYSNPIEKQLGGIGATVQARSGQVGTLAEVNGRIALVDTPNGRKEYDALYLKKVDAPNIDQEDSETESEANTLYPPTPSDDPLVERARQIALRAIGDSKHYLEDQIRGRAGYGSPEGIAYNFGGGSVLLNYGRPNPYEANYARNQIAITLDDDTHEMLFRFNAFKLLEWKLTNQPSAQVDLTVRAQELGADATIIEGVNYKRDSKVTRPATPNESQPNDRCQTPPYALDPLLQYLGWSLPSTIWEPACGEGLLIEGLYDAGWTEEHVIGTDILTGQNFFEFQPDKWEVIVTNPPYSLKLEWLERCYALGKPFALLVPGEFLFTGGVQDLIQKHGFEMMMLDSRVDFKMPNKGWEGTANYPTFWLCHDLLPEKVMFGSIKAAKKAFKAEIGVEVDDDPE